MRPVAKLSSTAKYTSIQDAIHYSKSTDTVTVLRNFETSDNIEIPSGKTITLDLAGYTITTTRDRAIINKGNLIVKDSGSSGKLYGGGCGIYNEGTGYVKFTGGTIYPTIHYQSTSTKYGIYNASSGTAELSGGTINLVDGRWQTGIYNESTGIIKITEGTISFSNASSYDGVDNVSNGTINMTGGTITGSSTGSSFCYGILNSSTGKVNMSDGCIDIDGSKCIGIENSSTGSITMTGGSIQGSAYKSYYGIENISTGTITLGIKDSSYNRNKPYIDVYGVSAVSSGADTKGIVNQNGGKFYFYDGRIISKVGTCIQGSITGYESGYNSVRYIKYGEDHTNPCDPGEEIAMLTSSSTINYSKLEKIQSITENNTHSLNNMLINEIDKNEYSKTKMSAIKRDLLAPQVVSNEQLSTSEPIFIPSIDDSEWSKDSIKVNIKSYIYPQLNLFMLPSNLRYKIEYYNNNQLNTFEYVENQVYEDIIQRDDIEQKVNEHKGDGYRLANNNEISDLGDKTADGGVVGTPLKIAMDESSNIIKVYYVPDENQKHDVQYTVEYYLKGNKDSKSTQTESQEVQKLITQVPIKTNNIETKVNEFIENGYLLSKITVNDDGDYRAVNELEGQNIEQDGVIRVYLVPDETKKHEIQYTVQYYLDDNIDEQATQVRKEKVLQVITNLAIDKSLIDDNKYESYKILRITVGKAEGPVETYNTIEEVPNEVEDQSIIKIYYKRFEALIADTKFMTLEEAIAAANTTIGTSEEQIEIDLANDVEKGQNITINNDKNVKLDLNGHNINITTGCLKNNGKLEIIDSKENGTITGKNNGIENAQNAVLKVSSGKITTASNDGVVNNGQLTVEGGEIIGQRNGVLMGSNGTLTLKLGRIKAVANSGINNTNANATINIENGTVEAPFGITVSGNMNITGGRIIGTNYYGIRIDGGTTTVTNGRIYGANYGIRTERNGTLVLGIKDRQINTKEIVVEGNIGVKNNGGIVKFYDRIRNNRKRRRINIKNI